MSKQECVHCGLPCEAQTEEEKHYNICIRPDCPNFGLLQIDLDQIKKFNKDNK